jgi:hypothetical protein
LLDSTSQSSVSISQSYQLQQHLGDDIQRHLTNVNVIREALTRPSKSHLVLSSQNPIYQHLPIVLCLSAGTSTLSPRFLPISRARQPGLTSNLALSHQPPTSTNMSRVTPPVTKFAHALRTISSSANAGRPSGLLDSQARASKYLPRNARDLRAECKLRQLKSSGNKAEVTFQSPPNTSVI